jgi:hypothetical protein
MFKYLRQEYINLLARTRRISKSCSGYRHTLHNLNSNSYVFSIRWSFPQPNLSIETFSFLSNTIIDGKPTPLPYANFGRAAIRVPDCASLGILEELPVPSKPTVATVSCSWPRLVLIILN